MRFHDLRHSAATILLTRGVHPKVMQGILGHSSIAVTMDIYSHVDHPYMGMRLMEWMMLSNNYKAVAMQLWEGKFNFHVSHSIPNMCKRG